MHLTVCLMNSCTVPLYWVLIIDFANGVGVVLMCTLQLFEMVITQTLDRMRGIMMGVAIVMLGFGTLTNALFAEIFQQFLLTASPSCVFYYYHYSCYPCYPSQCSPVRFPKVFSHVVQF